MPASQEQKVDFLLKKIGYSASKTGIAEDESTISSSSNTAKAPFEEGIASPLVIPQSSILADSGYIPTTPPGSDTPYVKGYRTATALRMTRDSTVGTNTRSYIAYTTYNDTSSARLTNWIDTQFGASYIIKVFKGDPNSGGVELQQAGANAGTDGWFFDYSSGILNFNGVNLPSGISATNIYIVGYRYIGAIGIRPPAGIGTFEHLHVAGVSTFMGSIDANSNLDVAGISTFNSNVNVNADITANRLVLDDDGSLSPTLTIAGDDENVFGMVLVNDTYKSSPAAGFKHTQLNNGEIQVFLRANNSAARLPYKIQQANAPTGAWDSLTINADGAVSLAYGGNQKLSTTGYGVTVFGTTETQKLNVTGISTFEGNIDANGIIEGIAGQNKIPSLYANYSDLPSAGTYHGMFAHVHEHQKGYFAHAGGWYELVNKETTGIVGTGTETYNLGYLDATNLDVTGITTLGSIGISTGRITGPAITYIDPATVGDDTGLLVVKGNLQVEGTQTVVNSSTMTVTDKNIELAKGAANNAAADGGGITIDAGSDADKTWQWLDATDSWTSSEDIRIPDGKVFGFTPDVNTYIGRPAAETIAFTMGGSEKVRINSAGRVGIGTTVPYGANAGLEVYKATNNASINIRTGGAGAYLHLDSNSNGYYGVQLSTGSGANPKWFVGGYGSNDLNIQSTGGMASGTKVISINSNGNVGIGTNVMGAGGRSLTLAHVGNCTFTIRSGANSNGNIYFADGTSGTANYMGMIEYHQANNRMSFYTNGDTSNSKLRILSDGNVGINSASPVAKLDVNGTSQFQDDITILGTNPSVSSNKIIFSKSANLLRFFDQTKADFGQSGDLQIYHQFGINYIDCTNSSQLLIQSDDLHIRNAAGNQEIITTAVNDSVQLYYSGSQKFTTTNTGVSITGITTTTQLEIGTLGQSLVGITTILDEDNMASDSAAALATQQSIKKYVDDRTPQGPGGGNLAVSADSGSNESINLNTEVLDIEGTANEIETATGTNKVVIGLPNNVSIGGTLNVGVDLSVVGVSTFSDDVKLTVANGNGILLDKSANQLIINSGTHVRFQNNNEINTDDGKIGTALFASGLNIVGSRTAGGLGRQIRLYGDLLTNDIKPTVDSTYSIGTSSLRFANGYFDNLDVNENATFTGTISAGSTTGTDGYYLKSVGTGVTWAAFPSSRTGLTTSATAGQTSFNFSYNVGFVDVFLNGVKLPSSEFTASNGSTIVLDDAAFANDTLEFISLNTLPVSSGGASNLDGLADVTISGTPVIGETLQHNGSKFVNDYTVSATTTSTSQTAILNLPVATYRSVEYTIQITEGTKYHVTKILAIHDGTNATFNEFGTLTTNTSLSTFALDVNSGNMRLLATPASTNSTVFKVKFTGIKV